LHEESEGGTNKMSEYNERPREFNFPSERLFNTTNAKTYTYSKKIMKNNSVECIKLNQWVATNNCQYSCRFYSKEKK